MVTHCRLSAARPHIEAALRLLMECPSACRPFVVVEDTILGKFVQFVGGSGDSLRFDVPLLGIVVKPVPGDDVDLGAEGAVQTLRALGVPDFADVEIRFENRSDLKRGAPQA